MAFLVVSVLAVTVPYAFERFYLRRRVGIFALLFWVFVAQALLIGLGWALTRWGYAFEGVSGGLVAYLAGVALLTIGFTPLAAGLIAVVMFLLVGARHALARWAHPDRRLPWM